MMKKKKYITLLLCFIFLARAGSHAQVMDEMWDKGTGLKEHPNAGWFKDAKFGLFIHWGLYSKLAGKWNGRNYYGSGEWIMNQAKIPAAEYAKVASTFNPAGFDADEWAQLASDAGIRYLVITAKHHEGFAMFDSKASDFNIVKATPYGKDPMKALATATAKKNIRFGFYYSQFVDWHEPNGGRNTWDFDESKKNYASYYSQKAIPQLKELLTNYGPLGVVWFDLPGGLTKEETQKLVDSLHALQPQSLFSSRVGQGLGDYKDFGDSEIPDAPVKGAWESIYTHNDSWGYIEHDMNFKSPAAIIQLLAKVASKGGNLMLNVGPDGNGRIPYHSIQYLRETGNWLKKNGEAIYATTYGFTPQQTWGVTTAKAGRLFLHVFNRPGNGKLLVPGFNNTVRSVYALDGKQKIPWRKTGNDLELQLPAFKQDAANTVFVVDYTGAPPAYDAKAPQIVSGQYAATILDAHTAQLSGNPKTKSFTFSHYFGDWKHETCIIDMQKKTDSISFPLRVTEPGDYRVILEYSCGQEGFKQEGVISLAGQQFLFRSLKTGEFEKNTPLLFIKHAVSIAAIQNPGEYTLSIRPYQDGKELFKLRSVILEPVK